MDESFLLNVEFGCLPFALLFGQLIGCAEFLDGTFQFLFHGVDELVGEADVLVVAGYGCFDKFDLDIGRVFMPVGLEVATDVDWFLFPVSYWATSVALV